MAPAVEGSNPFTHPILDPPPDGKKVRTMQKKIFCFFLPLLLLSALLAGCADLFSDSDGDSSLSDYQFLYEHNAKELDGYTVRWASNDIKVYTGGISGAEGAINRWAGPVSFTFVNSPPSEGVSFSYTASSQYCGVTYLNYLNSGRITKATVYININQLFCKGGLENTITHEMAHALGFMGHTSDGSLMDPDGGDGTITTRLRNFMSLLYSMPYGTNINPYLRLKIQGPTVRYDPQGTRVIERVIY